MKEWEAAEEIRDVLARYGANGLLEECGCSGDMRITVSCVVSVDAAEEIMALIRRSLLRR